MRINALPGLPQTSPTPIYLLIAGVALSLLMLGCGDAPTATDPGGNQGQNTPGQGQTDEEMDRPDGQPDMPEANRYIVVLDRAAEDLGYESGERADNRERAESIAQEFELSPAQTYGRALFGFAATIPERAMDDVHDDERVLYVDPDGSLELFTAPADTTEPSDEEPDADTEGDEDDGDAPDEDEVEPTPWGLDRIGGAPDSAAGDGVSVYLVDTGIDAAHPQLSELLGAGHAVHSCAGETCAADWDDDEGHGTPLAGLIGARDSDENEVRGVVPAASLHAVKAFDQNGRAARSDVLAGLDWLVDHHYAAERPGVAVLGFGGDGTKQAACTADGFEYDPDEARSDASEENGDEADESADDAREDPDGLALHNALCEARHAGLVLVAAAGHDGSDASGTIPAAFDDAVLTATATDADDEQPDTSNTGAGVDLAAPGAHLLSTQAGGGTTGHSGTSMAAAYVAGGAALYLAHADLDPGPETMTKTRDTLQREAEDIGLDDIGLLNLRGDVFYSPSDE